MVLLNIALNPTLVFEKVTPQDVEVATMNLQTWPWLSNSRWDGERGSKIDFLLHNLQVNGQSDNWWQLCAMPWNTVMFLCII
jgi:hypothetical protein